MHHPAAGFWPVTTEAPEPPERCRQAQQGIDLSGFIEPDKRRADVVDLRRDPRWPVRRDRSSLERRRHLIRERTNPRRVTSANPIDLIGLLQLSPRELPHGLQHAVAWLNGMVIEPHQALVDEGGQAAEDVTL